MKIDVSRVASWSAEVEDHPGAVAEKLHQLREADIHLDFMISRRDHRKTGKDIIFVTPISGAGAIRAARKAGFEKTESLHELKIECADKTGIGAKLTTLLADAGINLRGISGAAINKKAVFHIAFESKEDASKAMRTLKRKADQI